MCIVLCCCVQYVEVYIEQTKFANDINFLFHLKKSAAESYRLFRETCGEHTQFKIRVSDGFGVSKVVTSRMQTRNMEQRKKIHGRGIACVVARG